MALLKLGNSPIQNWGIFEAEIGEKCLTKHNCTSEEELALVIRAMRDWMKVRKEQPYSLKSILQQTRVDRNLLTEGLLCAFDDALEAEQREKARFLYKQEIEFRYCRMEMERLVSRGSSENRRGNRSVVGRIKSKLKI